MESWRQVWRDGVAPLLSIEGLEALAGALERDDPRLAQGYTTDPLPLVCLQEERVRAACPIGYAGWQSLGLETVGEVAEIFARICFDADQRLGRGGCMPLVNWIDDTPRDVMRRELLGEVRRELAGRQVAREV